MRLPLFRFLFRVVPGKTALENLHVIRTQGFLRLREVRGGGRAGLTDNPFFPAAFYVHFKRAERSGAKLYVLRCVFNSWYVTFH